MLGPDELPPLEVHVFDYEPPRRRRWRSLGRRRDGVPGLRRRRRDHHERQHERLPSHLAAPRICAMLRMLTGTTIPNYGQPDGSPFTFPVYLSSVALQKLGHDDESLPGSAPATTRVITSSPRSPPTATTKQEAASFDMDFFFQLYVNQDRSLVQDMVQNAESHGCRALFVTVDAPQLGRRDRDMRMKTVDNSSVAQVQDNQEKDVPQDQGTTAAITSFIDPASAGRISSGCIITKMDIVLKGIQTGRT